MNKEFLFNSLMFFSKFFGIFIIGYIVLGIFNLTAFQELIAILQSNLLGLSRQGTLLFIGVNAFNITESCTGIISAFMLIALTFSFPKPRIEQKIIISLIGASVLILLNVFRVYLVLVGGIIQGVEFAELLHTASWFFMSIIAALLWFILTKKISNVKSIGEIGF